jgi:phosphoglycerate kinase
MLPSVKDLKITGKKVLLRCNLDVPLSPGGSVADDTRIQNSIKTIKYLLSRDSRLIMISHLDRPGGKPVPGLSLKPVVARLKLMLPGTKINFSGEIIGEKTKRMAAVLKPKEILVLENLRFDPGEKANDRQFTQALAALADCFVNDDFAASHRSHASIVGLATVLPSALGLSVLGEVAALSKVRQNPQRPVVIILGGKKRSKTRSVAKMADWADNILVGGQLIEYDGVPEIMGQHRKILGSLTKDGEDITMETVKKFKKVIAKAKTIVWAGPMGVFEEKRFERGTREVAKAVVESEAYKVVGGGDTEAALSKFGLLNKIDYVSSGGGAMLAYLADGTLPGIEAIRKNG